MDSVASGGVSPVGDVVMSGGYEVGADGKLLRPKDAPIPVPPVKLDIMEHETPEGMEAFARCVVALAPYTWMSGDTRKLEEVSRSDCEWCKRMIESTSLRQENGGWVTGASIEIVSVSKAFEIPDHPHWWHIDLEYHRSPMVSYDGREVSYVAEERLSFAVETIYEDGRWVIYEIGK